MRTTLLLFAMAFVGTIHAAEKIRYDEIPKHLAPFGTVLQYRGFTVTTLDGKRHSGRTLELAPTHLRIFQGNSPEDLASDQISRIEIRQFGRFHHHVPEATFVPFMAGLFCDSNLCFVEAAALFFPLLAYPAAAIPFFLAADGIAFFIPPKVYEIVH